MMLKFISCDLDTSLHECPGNVVHCPSVTKKNSGEKIGEETVQHLA